MSKKSVVCLWDMSHGAVCVKTAFYNLGVREALICAIHQYNGDFNTLNYPTDETGIYKSLMVKDRLIYDLSDDLTLTSQNA